MAKVTIEITDHAGGVVVKVDAEPDPPSDLEAATPAQYLGWLLVDDIRRYAPQTTHHHAAPRGHRSH